MTEALDRVRTLARLWADTEGATMDAAVHRRVGEAVLDATRGPGGGLAAARDLAERWLRPGNMLYYPAAGQAVLDAIAGRSDDDLDAILNRITDSADELTDHEEGDGCGLGGRSCTGHDAHRMVAALRAVLKLMDEARGCCYNYGTTPTAWENFDPAAVRATILANLTGEGDR